MNYQKKYLSLKHQEGGYNNIFHIYTTGIANWGNPDANGDVNILWSECFCQQICAMIPHRFRTIDITHCDLLLYVDEEKKEDLYLNIQQKLLNQNIPLKVRNVDFQTDPLDFELISIQEIPYIVIDIAHIFGYVIDELSSNIITRAYIKGAYGEDIRNPISLNVVYLGFLENGTNSINLSETSFFNVNTDDTITTYINKILNNERFILIKTEDYDQVIDPMLKIDELVKNIIKKIYDGIRRRYSGSIDIYDEKNKHNVIEIELKKELINLIMTTDIIENVLIDSIYSHIMKKYFS